MDAHALRVAAIGFVQVAVFVAQQAVDVHVSPSVLLAHGLQPPVERVKLLVVEAAVLLVGGDGRDRLNVNLNPGRFFADLVHQRNRVFDDLVVVERGEVVHAEHDENLSPAEGFHAVFDRDLFALDFGVNGFRIVQTPGAVGVAQAAAAKEFGLAEIFFAGVALRRGGVFQPERHAVAHEDRVVKNRGAGFGRLRRGGLRRGTVFLAGRGGRRFFGRGFGRICLRRHRRHDDGQQRFFGHFFAGPFRR